MKNSVHHSTDDTVRSLVRSLDVALTAVSQREASNDSSQLLRSALSEEFIITADIITY
jgi:hypothetical protein